MEKEQNGVARVANQARFTEAERRALAQWSVGKSEAEIKARAAEAHTSSGSVYAWRRQYFPDAGKAITTSGRSPAERAAAYREAKASGNVSAWAKAHGLKASTVRTWGSNAELTGTSANKRHAKKLGHQANYSLAQKREILGYAASHSVRATKAKFQVSQSTLGKWRKEEAAGRLTETRRGQRSHQKNNPRDDAELLEADHTDRARAREKRDELAELRKEVLVLRANIALARSQGYMKWMDIEETLGMGRKR